MPDTRRREFSPEHRAKLSKRNRGRKPTPELLAQLLAANRRNWQNPEYRAKMAAARTSPVITHANIGAGVRRRWLDSDYRAKVSAGLIGNTNARDASVKGVCVYCGDPATTHDHVIPTSRGGPDTPDNIVLACLSCNTSKGQRTPEEWFAVEELTA